MRKAKLSIIMTAYNNEEYVKDAVLSVINQKFTEFELIIVDDGSSDDTGIILDALAKTDNRIKVFHQKNQGQMKAILYALSHASGFYIGFVDADDLIKEDMYSSMIEKADEYDVDIVTSTALRFNKNKSFPLPDTLPSGFYNQNEIKTKILPHLFSNKDLLGSRGIQPSKCFKLFKKTIVDFSYSRISSEFVYAEDLIFTYTCILYAKKIYIMDQREQYYLYRLNPSSVSWKYRNNLFDKSMKIVSYFRNEETVKDNILFQKDLDYTIIFFAINSFLNEYMMKNSNSLKTRKEKIKAMISSSMLSSALENTDLSDANAGNRILATLMKRKNLAMLTSIGNIIAIFRFPITKISQLLF